MSKNAEYFLENESKFPDFWKVWTPQVYLGEKKRGVIVPNRNEEPRFYALSDEWTQRRMLNQLILVCDQASALDFSEEWGLLIDADRIDVAHLIDAAKSTKWLYEHAQLKNKPVKFSELKWPDLSPRSFIPPFLLTRFSLKKRRVVPYYFSPAELADAQKAWVNKVIFAPNRKPNESTKELQEIFADFRDENFKETTIELHKIVALFLNDMLEQIAPVVVLDQGSLQLRTLLTPWSAVVQQLVAIAVGSTKPEKCRRPGCTKPVERKRITKMTCSDACQKWCRREELKLQKKS